MARTLQKWLLKRRTKYAYKKGHQKVWKRKLFYKRIRKMFYC